MPPDARFAPAQTPYSVRLDLPSDEVEPVLDWAKRHIPRRWNYAKRWIISSPAFSRETIYLWFEDAADAVFCHLHFR